MRKFVRLWTESGLRAVACAGVIAAVMLRASPDPLAADQGAATAGAQQAPLPAAAAPPPTSLAALVDELATKSPDVRAARTAATATTYAASQVSSLPDPQVTLQQLDVGNPLPFAGYTSNGFGYVGAGVSQELPYPGKRALRAAVARADTDVAQAHVGVVTGDQIERLRATYARLAFLQATLTILRSDQDLLQPIEQEAEARYASGQGTQQEVLRAQLERTKLLRDISMNRRSTGEVQAALKRLVGRSQDSADVVTEAPAATFLQHTSAELLNAVRSGDPNVVEQSATVTKSRTAVSLAQKEFRPDFGVAFMYQNTGPSFPDYYMGTFNVTFHRRAPRDAALAEAQVKVEQAQQEVDLVVQDALAELQRQYVVAKTSEEQLLMYRDGLIPQARASVQAALVAYQANRQDFTTLLSSFTDVLTLNLQYQQTLLDHATALARIERLTGIARP